jgi:hypothetical protein
MLTIINQFIWFAIGYQNFIGYPNCYQFNSHFDGSKIALFFKYIDPFPQHIAISLKRLVKLHPLINFLIFQKCNLDNSI